MSLPAEVTAASGMDIVCHAVESYTAKWYTQFDRKKPEERVTYCGSNPVSDLWCEKAMGLIATSFRASVHEGSLEHRSNMLMAATFAGMGFGNAGVHIPHANAYPIAGMVQATTGPRATRRTSRWCRTGSRCRSRRRRRSGSPSRARPSGTSARPRCSARMPRRTDPAEQLPSVLVALMRDIGIPNGIGGVGYTEDDVPDLVPGTMKQQRLLATCPRTPTEDDIAGILTRSVENW